MSISTESVDDSRKSSNISDLEVDIKANSSDIEAVKPVRGQVITRGQYLPYGFVDADTNANSIAHAHSDNSCAPVLSDDSLPHALSDNSSAQVLSDNSCAHALSEDSFAHGLSDDSLGSFDNDADSGQVANIKIGLQKY